MSFLSSNVSLIDYSMNEKTLSINFNDYILSDASSDKILEEVIYTINLSVLDNFDVENLQILVNNEKIYENSLKTIDIK